MRYDELKTRAVDETKIGGDGQKAIALAILTLAQVVQDNGDDLRDSLDRIDKSFMMIADAISDR